MLTLPADLSRLLDELADVALVHAARLPESLTVTLRLDPPKPDRQASVDAVVRRDGRPRA